MPSLNASSGTIFILQILTSAFLGILFLQSGIDKIVDRRGNLEFLQGHSVGWNGSLARNGNHGFGNCCGRPERDWMRDDNSYSRPYGRVLRRGHLSNFDRRPLLWSANSQRLRRCGSSSSLLPARAERHLSTRALRQQFSFIRNDRG